MGSLVYSGELARPMKVIFQFGYDLCSIASRSEQLMVRESNRGRLVLQAIVFWVIAPTIALSLLM